MDEKNETSHSSALAVAAFALVAAFISVGYQVKVIGAGGQMEAPDGDR